MITVQRIRNIEQWALLQPEWDRLAGGVFTRRYAWLRAWWDTYGDEYQLSILIAKRGEEIIGAMPLARQESLLTGINLYWLGSGKPCSDNMGILCVAEDESAVAEAFAGFLQHQATPDDCWDHLDLDGVRPDNRAMNLFLDVLVSQANVQYERKSSVRCWALDITCGWDDYLKSLSKRARKLLKNCQLELGINSRFEVAQSRDEAIGFLADIRVLHQARWQDKGIRGCFSYDHFSQFVENAVLMHWSDDDDQVLLTRLKINNETAAGAICFVHAGVFSIYLVGMQPELGEHRPGWQNNNSCIQLAMALGCHTVDFMRGDEEYKERLGAVPCAQERWVIASPRLASVIRNRAYKTAVALKNWTLSIASPPPV